MIPKSPKPQKKSKSRVSRKVKDYGNDPFFVEKAHQSKLFLEKMVSQRRCCLRNNRLLKREDRIND